MDTYINLAVVPVGSGLVSGWISLGFGWLHVRADTFGLWLGWSSARPIGFAAMARETPTVTGGMVTLCYQLDAACYLQRHQGCLPWPGWWCLVAWLPIKVTLGMWQPLVGH